MGGAWEGGEAGRAWWNWNRNPARVENEAILVEGEHPNRNIKKSDTRSQGKKKWRIDGPSKGFNKRMLQELWQYALYSRANV